MINEGRETFERGIFLLGVAIFFFIVGILVGVEYQKRQHISRPVEETIIKVDSLVKVNDSIKIKVEQLDSIKNAKIVEVQVLDNDSTVKLFYELIK